MTLPACSYRPERLTVLDFGLFQVHADQRKIGIPGFLVQMDDGLNLLIDTGFPPVYADQPEMAGRRDGLDGFGRVLQLTPENLLAGQLARLGLTPADIGVTVLTHSHIDHIGGLPQLTHAPVVLGQAERAEPRPLYHGDRRPMDWPAAVYHPINDDTPLSDAFILIPTPGHTAGHLSVLMTLPETGPVILTADALSRPSEMLGTFADAADPDAARASAGRLLSLASGSGAMVIWGHCPNQWPSLRKAPDFYA